MEETPNYPGRNNYLDTTPQYSWSSAAIHDYLTGRSALHLPRRFEYYLRKRIQTFDEANSSDVLVLHNFLDFLASQVMPALLVRYWSLRTQSWVPKGILDLLR